jgi:HAD superfamily hydrolase (TIGR01509 family)
MRHTRGSWGAGPRTASETCLETEDVAIAVATSTESDDAAFTLRSAGLDTRFRVIVTGDQVVHGKPAPDIYLEAARRLQIAPAQCVALEDSEAGIVAARRRRTRPIASFRL